MNEERGYDQVTAEDFLEHEGFEYRGPLSGRSGMQFNVKVCPRCSTEDWKVYLGVESGLGNCFKCGPFNLWSFAKAHLGTEDSKAIGKLFDEIAKLGGWKPKKRALKRDVAPAIEGEVKLPHSIELPTHDGRTLPYIDKRGITNDLARYFGLRYCHDGAFKYAKEDGSPQSMVFSGRVIIPVWDLDRTLVTFQGRDITRESDRKYLFPPRLPGTARFLYNGHNAIGAAHIAMGEGAFDVIATKKALDQDAAMRAIVPVGSFGKNLTLTGEQPNQLTALLKLKAAGLKIITIIWDGTPDALSAAVDAAQQLTAHGFQVRIAFLPKGCDPNEVEPAVVRYAIANARPYSRTLAMKIKVRNPYK
jgi:DNA primase